MTRRIGGWIGILGAAIALTACFDDGGSSAVPLKTEQDVMREMSNLFAIGARPGVGSPWPASTATGYRAPVARSGGWAGPKGPREVIPCDAGTVEVTEHFDTARSYPLLGVTFGTDYRVSEYDDCETFIPDLSIARTGRLEVGDNANYRTGEDPELGYSVAGSGNTAFEVVSFSGWSFETRTTRLLGRGETRDDATTHESRDAMELDLVYDQSFRASIDVGESDDPLIVHTDFGGTPETLSVDGPIRYSSNFCEGGRLRYDTVTPLTVGEDETRFDENHFFFNGGELIIEAGSRSVTLVFHENGDIDYEFDNGTSGTITRDELLAGGEGGCLAP